MSTTISYYNRRGDHIDTHYFDCFHDEDHAERLVEEYWPSDAVEARVESLDFIFEAYHTPIEFLIKSH